MQKISQIARIAALLILTVAIFGVVRVWFPGAGSPAPVPQAPAARGDVQPPDESAKSAPAPQTAAAVQPNPLSQKERVETIQKSSLDQLVESLASFDDVSRASTADGGRPFSALNPESVNPFLTRLFRVRRLLEMAEADRELIARKMETTLREALIAWPAAYKEEYALRESATGQIRKDKPTTHDILRVQAEAATYVLGEIGSRESLRVLLESYRQQNQWIEAVSVKDYRHIPQCPVPPPLTLYAMHVLVMGYPDEGLDDATRAAHVAYRTWAATHLPDPVTYAAARSNSLYDESDARNRIVDPARQGLKNQPTITLRIYPAYFADRTRMLGYPAAPYLSDQGKEWFKVMDAFLSKLPGMGK